MSSSDTGSIAFPSSPDDIDVPDGSMIRAGGTDLQQRLRSHNAAPDLVDLTRMTGFAGIETAADGRLRIGAGTKIAAVAAELIDRYPALAATAGGLATPQIRNVATIGGNLLQRTRCWYYRHPEIGCFKSGGDSCPARTGRHLYGVVFDRSACVHPHPSSIAMALLTYDATVTLADESELTVAELLGDGVDPTRDNLLPDGAVVVAVNLPAPMEGERAAYFRTISRFEAEWPLVEAVARARLGADGIVSDCAVGLGGVATVPLRMTAAEQELSGRPLDDDRIRAAAEACTAGVKPLAETGYKVELIRVTVTEVLERLSRSAG